jgi:hypothetical protein
MNPRVGLLAALLLGLLGCAHQGQQTRLQAADEDKESEVKTIGDVTTVSGADPVQVMGVGLVTGLDGNGGGAPPGTYRTILEDHLRKIGVDRVKEVLASRDVSLVLVSAMVPAGARKGDPLDVEATLPPQSQTKSLRGGYLQECVLYNYESSKNLDPESAGPERWLKGHPVARAEGPLLVGFGDGDEAAKERQGRIWGGGKCQIDRPFFLILNSDQQYARLASLIADRINETFHGSTGVMPGTETASAKSKAVVYLSVPPQYKLNLPRYLRVARLIPLRDAKTNLIGSNPAVAGPGSHYRRKLEQELLDPAKTVTAALRLEALGSDSVTSLKRGLESDHVLVRFSSAEALAYLNSPSCGEVLGRIVEGQPALRAFGLTALASLNEAVSQVQLNQLLRSNSAETRYGAFRALRALDEHDDIVQGELLNDSFWLHRVAPNSPPLVHMSSSRRPEIVLFGEDAELLPPFSILTGEFTITANRDDEHCTVARISTHHGRTRQQCSLKVRDVLHTMAEQGASYPEVVELIRQMDRCKCLTCAVAVDALPQATSIYELARVGKDGELLKTDQEILNAKADFGATPNLLAKPNSKGAGVGEAPPRGREEKSAQR